MIRYNRGREDFKLIKVSVVLKLFILHVDPPEITLEHPIIYSGEGQEAVLSCIVHGETQPQVSNDD